MRVVAWLLALSMVSVAGCFSEDDPSQVADPVVVADPSAAPPKPPAKAPELGPRWPHHPNDGASIKEDLLIEAFDGTSITATLYKPAVANATTQFPVLLHSHGFTGSRATADDAFKDHIAAGFAVVSYDQRGHGDRRGDTDVKFMHPDWEVKDISTVIDTIASWDWVLLENATTRDPLLGTIGSSYGGAFQLMGSIFDDRIDAMVPEITWHNITEALAPNGAIKSGWVDLFYAAGNAQRSVTFNDDFHRGFAWATATNELPAGQLPEVPDLVTGFNLASPESYPGQLDIPAMFVQGMPDTLFPLNHAVHNFLAIEASGQPAYLYSHNGGHILNSESLAPGQSPVPAGLQGAPGGRPCGAQAQLEIAFHQRHLLELDVPVGPKVCIALEDDTAIVGERWPLPWTDFMQVDFPGPYPVAQVPAGYTLPLEAYDPPQESVVAGIPRLTGTITSPGADAILYWSLQILRADGVMEHIVDDQVIPLRIKGPNTGAIDFDIELGGVATKLSQDDVLFLVMSTIEPMYFGNSERIPGGLVVEDLQLTLPVVQYPIWKS